MKPTRSHRTNNKILTVMVAALFIAIILMHCGCTATNLEKSSSRTETKMERQIKDQKDVKTTLFDRSKINEEDYSLHLVPIDPTKRMAHWTNLETGEHSYQNAIPYYEKKTKQTNKNITQEKKEAKTTSVTDQNKAITDDQNKEKSKFSIPWYVFLILGFFGFAIVVGLFLIYNLTKNLTRIAGVLPQYKNLNS